MIIDIVFLLLLALGFFLGFRKGLLHAFFALVSLFLGTAVAVKFTSLVTEWLYSNSSVTSSYLPFIVFLVLFIIVVLMVRGLGMLLEKLLDSLALNFVNRFLGAVLWCVILTFILSLFVWFSDVAGMIQPEVKADSYTYIYLQQAAPILLAFFSEVMPWFQGMFEVINNQLDKLREAASSS